MRVQHRWLTVAAFMTFLLVVSFAAQAGTFPYVADQPFQLTYNNAWSANQPMFSPDATSVVYYRETGAGATINIAVYNLVTHTDAQLTTDNRSQTPSFTRDGSRILYSSAPDQAKGDIWVMNVDGTHQTALTNFSPDFGAGMPNQLPDGRIVLQTSDPMWSISVVNADGSGRTSLPVVSNAQQPRASPDGRYVTYASQAPDGTQYDVYLYDFQTGVQTQLTHEAAEQGYPSFSPDGKWIVYQSKEGGAFDNIWIMDLAGGNRTQLTFADFDQRFPVFSPDGRTIVFSAQDDSSSIPYLHLWAMDLTPVPEPISMIFFGTGLVAVGGFVARRRAAKKA